MRQNHDSRRRDFLKGVGAGGTAALARAAQTGNRQRGNRPNILLILADDLGWSDLSCYGSEIPTPNLDALAQRGVRFTNFHNAARCCPSRACIQTGVYPHRAGVGHMLGNWRAPSYTDGLSDNVVTIPEVLKTAGYRTLMAGKWHLGWRDDGSPTARGYERFYGTRGYVDSYYNIVPRTDVYLGDKLVIRAGEKPVNPLHPGQEWYTTDVYTDYGVRFMNEAMAGDVPFFAYMAYNAPHFPLHAKDGEIRKHLGVYDAGWERLRAARYKRMQSLGLLDRRWTLPETGLRRWDSLSSEEKRNSAFRMSLYAANITRLDRNVGRLISTLRDGGRLENTLILFLSDNGASGEGDLFGFNSDNNRQDNYASWQRAGGWTSSYGEGWASVSNTPFRMYKKYTYEGGTSSPLIVSWPGRIRARGTLCPELSHIVDLMPTLLDAAGAQYPESRAGTRTLSLDGVSLLPAIQGAHLAERALYWEHEGNRAVRIGKWKLVANYSKPWELYDMEKDRSETHDLAATNPGLVRDLESMYARWTDKCHVFPWQEVNPRINNKK